MAEPLHAAIGDNSVNIGMALDFHDRYDDADRAVAEAVAARKDLRAQSKLPASGSPDLTGRDVTAPARAPSARPITPNMKGKCGGSANRSGRRPDSISTPMTSTSTISTARASGRALPASGASPTRGRRAPKQPTVGMKAGCVAMRSGKTPSPRKTGRGATAATAPRSAARLKEPPETGRRPIRAQPRCDGFAAAVRRQTNPLARHVPMCPPSMPLARHGRSDHGHPRRRRLLG